MILLVLLPNVKMFKFFHEIHSTMESKENLISFLLRIHFAVFCHSFFHRKSTRGKILWQIFTGTLIKDWEKKKFSFLNWFSFKISPFTHKEAKFVTRGINSSILIKYFYGEKLLIVKRPLLEDLYFSSKAAYSLGQKMLLKLLWALKVSINCQKDLKQNIPVETGNLKWIYFKVSKILWSSKMKKEGRIGRWKVKTIRIIAKTTISLI